MKIPSFDEIFHLCVCMCAYFAYMCVCEHMSERTCAFLLKHKLCVINSPPPLLLYFLCLCLCYVTFKELPCHPRMEFISRPLWTLKGPFKRYTTLFGGGGCRLALHLLFLTIEYDRNALRRGQGCTKLPKWRYKTFE